jgi:hypothetical protein
MKILVRISAIMLFFWTSVPLSVEARIDKLSLKTPKTSFTFDLNEIKRNKEIDSIQKPTSLTGIIGNNIYGDFSNIENKKIESEKLSIKNANVDYDNADFTRVRKLEYYIASSNIKSNIISDTIGVSTTSNSISNLSIGLNFRYYSRNSQLGSMWILRYQDYGFSILPDSIEKNPETLKVKQVSFEFRATAQGKRNFHPVISMGVGVNYPIQVNYTDSQRNEITSKLFELNDYVRPTPYTVLGFGLALEKKKFSITLEAILRINGFLVQSSYLNHKKFEYSKYNEQSFGSGYFEKSIGISFRFF